MGTNFYLESEPPCPCCGRPYAREHIGKNSGGWVFCWQASTYSNYERWQAALVEAEKSNRYPVVDEYGTAYTVAEFLECINHPEPGLLNLKAYHALPENRELWHGGRFEDYETVDEQGWRFCRTEFS